MRHSLPTGIALGSCSSSDWFDTTYKAFTTSAGLLSSGRFNGTRPRVGVREVLSGLRRHVFESPCVVVGSDFGKLLSCNAFVLLAERDRADC